MMKTSALSILFWTIAKVATAEECSNFLGQQPTPTTIQSVISAVSTFPAEKDEFETTEQHNARIQSLTQNTPSTYIVYTNLDSRYAIYDADNQIFKIKSFAIDNINARLEAVFGYGSPLYGRTSYSSIGNIDIIIYTSERTTGTYRGRNSFGATATISEVTRSNIGIFERGAQHGEDLFFRNSEESRRADNIIGTIPADATTARALKDTMRAAVVIAPKAPWHASGDIRWGEPTIADPVDLTETVSILIADIQCALVLDASNKVLLAISTR